MTLLEAVVLGVVEGLTEFLPVSSTGHLVLASSLLGIQLTPAVNAYLIAIQLGAILAVVTIYKQHAISMFLGLLGRDRDGLQLFLKLFLAFLPAAFLGLLLDHFIDRHLMKVVPVALALIAGGIVMIGVEYWFRRKTAAGEIAVRELPQFGFGDALAVGLAQCFSLWPGTSRSMTTIVSSQLRGFTGKAAAEISFLLALPTLGAATVYKMFKYRHDLFAPGSGITHLAVGNVVAFVVAWAAVKGFVAVVTRFGMTPFGIYRILLGLAFLGFISEITVS